MDDEDIIRRLITLGLEDNGYHVSVAKNGEEAIEIYKKELETTGSPFDALILDITVPDGMGAEECMKILLQMDKNVRAIVSSGYPGDKLMLNYEKYGFKGIIAKPYKMDVLKKTLESVIGGR